MAVSFPDARLCYAQHAMDASVHGAGDGAYAPSGRKLQFGRGSDGGRLQRGRAAPQEHIRNAAIT